MGLYLIRCFLSKLSEALGGFVEQVRLKGVQHSVTIVVVMIAKILFTRKASAKKELLFNKLRPFVEQKLTLSCSFRYYKINNCPRYYFGHCCDT
jgi:hypothetical protein